VPKWAFFTASSMLFVQIIPRSAFELELFVSVALFSNSLGAYLKCATSHVYIHQIHFMELMRHDTSIFDNKISTRCLVSYWPSNINSSVDCLTLSALVGEVHVNMCILATKVKLPSTAPPYTLVGANCIYPSCRGLKVGRTVTTT